MSTVLSTRSQPAPALSHTEGSTFLDYSDDQRLVLLRLLAYHKIRTLVVEPDVDSNEKWNLRESLGHGGSFLVQEANLPISSITSRLRYRDFKIKGPKAGPYFQDHTQTMWSYDSTVAFKIGEKHPDSLITELRILCHEPFQNHPNIVRLIGIAWITNQQSQDIHDAGKILEWPAILLEKAPHGSLNDFLTTSKLASEPRISLKTKVSLCLAVLKAIKVFHTLLNHWW